MRTFGLAAVLVAMATPAFAIDAGQTTVTCTAAVTTGLGTAQQGLKDLDPSDLPVLGYKDQPGPSQFKQIAKFGDVPVRLYVYRVNDKLLHMQIFEAGGARKGILADMPISGDMAELTYRSIGGSEMVTAYCY